MVQVTHEQDLMFWEGPYEVQKKALLYEVLSECALDIGIVMSKTLGSNHRKMHLPAPLNLRFRGMAKPLPLVHVWMLMVCV